MFPASGLHRAGWGIEAVEASQEALQRPPDPLAPDCFWWAGNGGVDFECRHHAWAVLFPITWPFLVWNPLLVE